MANLKTLKPFSKGHDSRRNLKGRPKGNPAYSEDALMAALQEHVTKVYGDPLTAEMAMWRKLLLEARKGKYSAVSLLFKYAYGKPVNYCPKCDYIATRSARKQWEDERNQEEAERQRIEEERRHLKNMEEAMEWQSRWFPKKSKGKRK